MASDQYVQESFMLPFKYDFCNQFCIRCTRVLYYSQHYIRCIDYIKDKECIVLTVVSKENDRHLHSIQTSMSHIADHQSSRNLATFLDTGMTFSCTNVLQDHCKKSHASKLLDKFEY